MQRGGVLALNQLSIGILDAVGWVSDPRDLDHVMLRAVRASRLASLSASGFFPFSPEEGTPAADLPDQIDDDEKAALEFVKTRIASKLPAKGKAPCDSCPCFFR